MQAVLQNHRIQSPEVGVGLKGQERLRRHQMAPPPLLPSTLSLPSKHHYRIFLLESFDSLLFPFQTLGFRPVTRKLRRNYLLYRTSLKSNLQKWFLVSMKGVSKSLLCYNVMGVPASALVQLEHDELDVSWVLHSWNLTKKKRNIGGFDFYKWILPEVGAICTFGVAAATICALLFGGWQKNKL